jgi:hypothetical protein
MRYCPDFNLRIIRLYLKKLCQNTSLYLCNKFLKIPKRAKTGPEPSGVAIRREMLFSLDNETVWTRFRAYPAPGTKKFAKWY